MSTESGQFVIADLLANAVEPWDNLTDQELASLNAADGDGSLPAPVVVAAYRNERGPVLIDGSQRLRWLASPPRLPWPTPSGRRIRGWSTCSPCTPSPRTGANCPRASSRS